MSRICACTVTSSAVVGSSAMSRSGSLAMAIAMTTRWRMPPDSSCGYRLAIRSGPGRPAASSRLTARRQASCRDYLAVQQHALGDLPADAVHRVQRGHRVLEHHRDLRAADPLPLRLAAAEQLGAGQPDRPGDLRRARQQAEHRQGQHGLAGAGLAHHAQGLAGGQRQRHATDRLDPAALGGDGAPPGRSPRAGCPAGRTGGTGGSAVRPCLPGSCHRVPQPLTNSVL